MKSETLVGGSTLVASNTNSTYVHILYITLFLVFLGKFLLIPFDATRKRSYQERKYSFILNIIPFLIVIRGFSLSHQTGSIEIYPRKPTYNITSDPWKSLLLVTLTGCCYIRVTKKWNLWICSSKTMFYDHISTFFCKAALCCSAFARWCIHSLNH